MLTSYDLGGCWALLFEILSCWDRRLLRLSFSYRRSFRSFVRCYLSDVECSLQEADLCNRACLACCLSFAKRCLTVACETLRFWSFKFEAGGIFTCLAANLISKDLSSKGLDARFLLEMSGLRATERTGQPAVSVSLRVLRAHSGFLAGPKLDSRFSTVFLWLPVLALSVFACSEAGGRRSKRDWYFERAGGCGCLAGVYDHEDRYTFFFFETSSR